jgi:zinc transport system permease protein
MPDFFWRAMDVVLVLSLLTAPLGSLVVWKKMAFFGDTLSHAALLGVALAFWLRIDPRAGVFAVSLLLALLLAAAQRQKILAIDTILGIVAHSSLALGIIIASSMTRMRVNLESFLFGDILAVGRYDALWLLSFALVMLPVLVYLWPTLVLGAVSRDLARVEGAPVEKAEHVLTFSFALLVAFAINVVGLLLLSAILIIPAAGARKLARTPASMVVYAMLIAMVSGMAGLLASFYWDTPTGPSIVAAAALLFVVISGLSVLLTGAK